MKTVDTYEYVSMLRELVEGGHEVSIPVKGSSMSPFLRDGLDTVYFKAPDRALKIGDIVFFQRRNGQYILHRICKIEGDCFYVIGDAQNEPEGPIAREQIFGVVTKVARNGKFITAGNLRWELFAKLWPRIVPLRPKIRRIYGAIK